MSRSNIARAIIGIALVAALGCGDGVSSPNLPVGTYRLDRIDLLQLPTPEPCGEGLFILNGHLVLLPHSRVTLVQHDYDEWAGWDLSYSGTGKYFKRGNELLLDLDERWSNDTTLYHRRLTLEIQDRQIIMHGLGAPCDGNSSAHYQLVE